MPSYSKTRTPFMFQSHNDGPAPSRALAIAPCLVAPSLFVVAAENPALLVGPWEFQEPRQFPSRHFQHSPETQARQPAEWAQLTKSAHRERQRFASDRWGLLDQL